VICRSRGDAHRPVAFEECEIIMLDLVGTMNTDKAMESQFTIDAE